MFSKATCDVGHGGGNLKGLHSVPSACIFSTFLVFSILLKTQSQCYFRLPDADGLNDVDSGRHAASTLRRRDGVH